MEVANLNLAALQNAVARLDIESAGERSAAATQALFSHKGSCRKVAHISHAQCQYAPLSLSHAVPVAPEVVYSTRMMWLVAG